MIDRLTDWFGKNRRELPFRGLGDPYAILVSETMAQQTRMSALVPYYNRFIERFPDVGALAEASETDVLALWAGLGYYSRARALHRTAKAVAEAYGGSLPPDPAALRSLPGIGDYTAGAVASIAFNLPTPAVDGNVRRVYARLFARDGGDAAGWVRSLMDKAPPTVVTESLMELGALVCTPSSPKCGSCPVASFCEAFSAGRVDEFPKKRAKPEKRVEERMICIVTDHNNRVLLRRRTERLLHGMWEFPTEEQLTLDGFTVVRDSKPLRSAKHVFTHIVWLMKGYRAKAERASPPENYLWRRDFADLPLPSAMRAWKETVEVIWGNEQNG
ncbi:MAG: A/G-specific adenine glycosylase [Oscillospiraceae bacterium]|nr:A/G-specific adenine glycosylase [Oscillospiraceae bacterium]